MNVAKLHWWQHDSGATASTPIGDFNVIRAGDRLYHVYALGSRIPITTAKDIDEGIEKATNAYERCVLACIEPVPVHVPRTHEMSDDELIYLFRKALRNISEMARTPIGTQLDGTSDQYLLGYQTAALEAVRIANEAIENTKEG